NEFDAGALWFRDGQARDQGVGVVGEADSVDAVGGLQLSGGYQVSLVVAGDYGAVDRAFDPAAFDGKSDLLRDGFSHACRFVYGGVVGALAAIHLKRPGTESAHDEFAVTVSRAVEIGLLRRVHIVAGDDDAVGMRVVIQIHELRFGEGGFHGVVAGGFV